MELIEITTYFKNLQQEICHQLEIEDKTGKFQFDSWKREAGGGGVTAVLSKGRILEKAGVAFSHIHGPMPKRIATRLNQPEGAIFHATGTSLVIHPQHPFVPVIHMNLRYFEVETGTAWFGGGIDLTPCYIDPQQAQWFHQQLKSACDTGGTDLYPLYKKACDEYFFLPHRNETRGVGGIFFDFLKPGDLFSSFADIFKWIQNIGNSFNPIYTALIKQNQDKLFTPKEKQFQCLRRGRYVEFNLLYDKGTAFGLDTGGRTESILMSLPPEVHWQYQFIPEPDSPEALTLSRLQPMNWLEFKA